MIFDRPRRTCASCNHWSRYPKTNLDGYLESTCTEPTDDRDHVLKRAADVCSKWAKRLPRVEYLGVVMEF